MRRRTSLLSAAVVIAAGTVVTAPLPHAAAVTENDHILVTNQYAGSGCGATNHQIQIANAMTGALVLDLNSPNSTWQIPNDAKPFDLNRKVVALWGGHSSFSGTNGIGVFDRTTGQWTTEIALPAFERGALGAHSITVLPDGYFAVAQTGQLNGAGSGHVVVVSPTGSIVDTDALSSAHGVEWDASRNAVFAIGFNDVRKYTYNTSTHQLTQAALYDLPGTNPIGHDLRRKRTADNDYLATVDQQVYTFDPESATPFTVLSMPAGDSSGVKSMDQRFDGVIEYSKYQSNQFKYRDRPHVTATFCLSGYKHGRWIYASGDPVYPGESGGGGSGSGIGYGFPINEVDDVQATGADLAYGSMWMGYWTNEFGFNDFRTWLDAAVANNVTPVIQWYYWGDAINANCYQTSCSGRTKSNWDSLALQLRNEIALKMQGRKTIIVLETEWHKNGMETTSTFDGWLRNQMDILRGDPTQDIDIALGWGHWADTTGYSAFTTYTQAAQYADYNGTMILFSCLDDRGEFAGINGSISKLISNAGLLKTKYNKPVLIDDVGLSTYSGASSNDSTYNLYSSYNRDCPVAYDYEDLQEQKYAEIFTRKAELAANGVFGLVFRAFKDAHNLDGTGQFHKIAERWWGIMRNTGTPYFKQSYDDVIDGIKGDGGGDPAPTWSPTFTVGGGANSWWIEIYASSDVATLDVIGKNGQFFMSNLPKHEWGGFGQSPPQEMTAGSLIKLIGRKADGSTAGSITFPWLQNSSPATETGWNASFTIHQCATKLEATISSAAVAAKVRIGTADWAMMTKNVTTGRWEKTPGVPVGTKYLIRAYLAPGTESAPQAYDLIRTC